MSEQDLKTQIAILENEIANLQDYLLDLKKSLLKLQNQNTDIVQKFNNWVNSGIADNEHYWIWHCKSSSGKDLCEYDGLLHWEKYQTIELEYIAETLNEVFYQLDSDGNYKNYKGSIMCTKQDILEWMQKLMDDNFASMECNW